MDTRNNDGCTNFVAGDGGNFVTDNIIDRQRLIDSQLAKQREKQVVALKSECWAVRYRAVMDKGLSAEDFETALTDEDEHIRAMALSLGRRFLSQFQLSRALSDSDPFILKVARGVADWREWHMVSGNDEDDRIFDMPEIVSPEL